MCGFSVFWVKRPIFINSLAFIYSAPTNFMIAGLEEAAQL